MINDEELNWSKLEGFEWDEGNFQKNQLKHNVEQREFEEVFFDQELIVLDDEVHSKKEKRYGLLGTTNEGRALVVFFTVRHNKIRIISARDQSKKERRLKINNFNSYERKKTATRI